VVGEAGESFAGGDGEQLTGLAGLLARRGGLSGCVGVGGEVLGCEAGEGGQLAAGEVGANQVGGQAGQAVFELAKCALFVGGAVEPAGPGAQGAQGGWGQVGGAGGGAGGGEQGADGLDVEVGEAARGEACGGGGVGQVCDAEGEEAVLGAAGGVAGQPGAAFGGGVDGGLQGVEGAGGAVPVDEVGAQRLGGGRRWR